MSKDALTADYAVAAADLLAVHLQEGGLPATASGDTTRTAIGDVTVRFEVESIESTNDAMQMVFWATIAEIPDLAGSPVRLDLLGLGPGAHEALADGVHALADGVLSVVVRDVSGEDPGDGVTTMQITSVTGLGRPRPWELYLGPAAIGGEPRGLIEAALQRNVLLQGIMDSITPALDRRQGHWLKLLLVRGPGGSATGDVKVDGRAIGVAPSFDLADWGDAPALIVRQFAIARPVDRAVDPTIAADLLERHGATENQPSLWRRLFRR